MIICDPAMVACVTWQGKFMSSICPYFIFLMVDVQFRHKIGRILTTLCRLFRKVCPKESSVLIVVKGFFPNFVYPYLNFDKYIANALKKHLLF
jgi:hypothetical protein